MTAYTFDQIIDFTRTSAATYVANTGFVTQAPASRNLLTYTQEFDNAAWSKSGSTITANSTTAPDGTTTADTLIETATTGAHGVWQQITASSGATYTYSAYLKYSTRQYVRLAFVTSGGTQGVYADVDLIAGTIINQGPYSTATQSGATITAVGNGWYRVSVTGTLPSATTFATIYLRNGSSNSNPESAIGYTGNGTDGILIWGAQLEAASSASTYTRNVGGVYPPRFDYDPVTLAPRGLLIEEQRTNLLLRSEEFDNAAWAKAATTVTANAATSPDGTANADMLVEDTANTQHFIYAGSSVVSGTVTFSVYAKFAGRRWMRMSAAGSSLNVWFDLVGGVLGTVDAGATATITSAGNGWYRCTVTATYVNTINYIFLADANNSLFYTGDGTSGIYLWGAQLEAGAFATSYIPTVASQVTRTADAATVTGANFSRWFNGVEGSLLAEIVPYTTNGNRGIASLNAGSSANRMDMRCDGSSLIDVAGVSQAVLSVAGMTANQVNKLVLAYKTNDFALVRNGGTPATDTSGSVPTVSLLQIGGIDNSPSFGLNGWVRRIRYYPTRLSNTQLQALTA